MVCLSIDVYYRSCCAFDVLAVYFAMFSTRNKYVLSTDLFVYICYNHFEFVISNEECTMK